MIERDVAEKAVAEKYHLALCREIEYCERLARLYSSPAWRDFAESAQERYEARVQTMLSSETESKAMLRLAGAAGELRFLLCGPEQAGQRLSQLREELKQIEDTGQEAPV